VLSAQDMERFTAAENALFEFNTRLIESQFVLVPSVTIGKSVLEHFNLLPKAQDDDSCADIASPFSFFLWNAATKHKDHLLVCMSKLSSSNPCLKNSGAGPLVFEKVYMPIGANLVFQVGPFSMVDAEDDSIDDEKKDTFSTTSNQETPNCGEITRECKSITVELNVEQHSVHLTIE